MPDIEITADQQTSFSPIDSIVDTRSSDPEYVGRYNDEGEYTVQYLTALGIPQGATIEAAEVTWESAGDDGSGDYNDLHWTADFALITFPNSSPQFTDSDWFSATALTGHPETIDGGDDNQIEAGGGHYTGTFNPIAALQELVNQPSWSEDSGALLAFSPVLDGINPNLDGTDLSVPLVTLTATYSTSGGSTTKICLGSNQILSMYVGSTPVSGVYLGSTQIM